MSQYHKSFPSRSESEIKMTPSAVVAASNSCCRRIPSRIPRSNAFSSISFRVASMRALVNFSRHFISSSVLALMIGLSTFPKSGTRRQSLPAGQLECRRLPQVFAQLVLIRFLCLGRLGTGLRFRGFPPPFGALGHRLR